MPLGGCPKDGSIPGSGYGYGYGYGVAQLWAKVQSSKD
jgi:hypothetical protein